ncbi:MAG: hypothetical protein QOI47_1578 [Actinomycetota bacterium]|jgi:glycosyltransferase involved in cell wall biosynthesis|nr:hypothetical protein [Actinomycetota bacterium]
MTPRVSIVMPAHRAAATIGAAVSGVLTQTCTDLELIVVDDGSDDATAAIVAAHDDDRVRLVRQDNRGVAAARNRGVAEATAPLIAFCDADDILLPGHVDALLRLERPRSIVTANAYWLLPGGISPSKLRHRGAFPAPSSQRMAILEVNFVSTMSLFAKALVAEIGPFDESLQRAEDWDFWLRAVFAGYTIVHQPAPHALYRWTATSLSASRPEMDADVRRVIERAARRTDLQDDERAYLRRRLAGPDPRQLYRDAEQALREGRHREAAELYGRAAALVPHEQLLVWTARLMRLAPPLVGRVLQRRQRAKEDALGFDEGHVR